MKEILFIDCCIRGQDSRTRQLCDQLLARLSGHITRIAPAELGIQGYDAALLEKRTALLQAGNWDDPMFAYARQFAAAQLIVIGAPYWDLSFPAALKAYLERVCITDLTFFYSDDGKPNGLCHAEKLYYVTTAGGWIGENNLGYEYVKALCAVFGIPQTEFIGAEALDLVGADVERIMNDVTI